MSRSESSTSTNESLGGWRAAAILVSLACVAASIVQAGSFLARLGHSTEMKVLYFGVAAALLFGSFVLARLSGAMLSRETSGGVAGLCIIVVICLEAFSIATSMSGFTSRLYESAREQNTESPEYITAHNTVIFYERQIAELQERVGQLPANYVTRSRELSDDIDDLMRQYQAAQDRAASIDVSTVGRTMDAVESTIGLDGPKIALLAALLLSAVPMSSALALGAVAGPGFGHRKKHRTGKG